MRIASARTMQTRRGGVVAGMCAGCPHRRGPRRPRPATRGGAAARTLRDAFLQDRHRHAAAAMCVGALPGAVAGGLLLPVVSKVLITVTVGSIALLSGLHTLAGQARKKKAQKEAEHQRLEQQRGQQQRGQ